MTEFNPTNFILYEFGMPCQGVVKIQDSKHGLVASIATADGGNKILVVRQAYSPNRQSV